MIQHLVFVVNYLVFSASDPQFNHIKTQHLVHGRWLVFWCSIFSKMISQWTHMWVADCSSFFDIDVWNLFIISQISLQVFEIAGAIGWVPAIADRNKTYLHLNQRIPNELKFDLNCLLYTHGKLCRKCTMKGSSHKKLAPNDDSCPLRDYWKNSNADKIK